MTLKTICITFLFSKSSLLQGNHIPCRAPLPFNLTHFLCIVSNNITQRIFPVLPENYVIALIARVILDGLGYLHKFLLDVARR